MSVAIYVNSKNGYNYLYSFGDNESEEQIKYEMESNLESFKPICGYLVSTSSDVSSSVETRLEEFMTDLFVKSWD
ncbi:hypothetical protein STP4a_121 [Salmonella phage STP4-a]|uniref:Uncharacterized protein n=1 Tax=Salmonella phage STP4-a TaxID=1445860 RepID=A0A0B4L918_9CAUD|nr:hypothetical protein STP4a_121 [Salmonella phage STP4-a]AHJ86975.1 hypothetical protein STP4a_121 [Salmonella phage STP4-a]UFK27246.1 hypothetical protein LG358_00225 [Escherichia phage UoN_LG358_1]